MLSNSLSLHWPNKIGAHRKAAHPSPMGRRHWSAQRCAEQQKVRSSRTSWTRNGCAPSIADRSTEGNGPPHRTTLVKF